MTYAYEPHEDTEAQQYARDLEIRAAHDRYEAALRKIAAWKGYTISDDHEYERFQRGYEQGANDMLSTLQAMAREVLA